MRTYLPLAGVAALLSLWVPPLHAGNQFRLETRLYLYRTGDARGIAVSGKNATSNGHSMIVQSPDTITFNQMTLALEGSQVTWSGAQAALKQLSLSAAPTASVEAGQPAIILASAPAQYLERQPDGSLRVRDIPADSPEAPHFRVAFTVSPPADATGDLSLACDWDIATVRSRNQIPGVALEVGKPLMASFQETLAFTARANQWTALLLRAPAGSDYGMLVLLKVVPVNAPDQVLAKVATFHLKTGRYGAIAVTDGSYVYVVGGQNSGGILSDIERFDVRTHESTRLTNDLTPRRGNGAALIGGKIYVFGGEGYNSRLFKENPFEASMDIYDLASGRITHGAPMPHPRAGFATASVDGKIYAIGGSELVGPTVRQTNRTEIYDPATDTWSEGIPAPTARNTRAATAVNGRIIVAGGYRPPDVATGLKTVECFVPGKNQWFSLPDLAEPIRADSAAVLGNCLYLFGNYDPANKVMAYDLATHASTVFRHGFIPASQAAAVTLNDSIYVIGGIGNRGLQERGGGDERDDIQVFSLSAGADH